MTQAKRKGLFESARFYCQQELDGWHIEPYRGGMCRVFKRDGSDVFSGLLQDAFVFIQGAVIMKREIAE